MKTLLKIMLASLLISFGSAVNAESVTDIYKFTLTLKVPRIYNNTESLGYRKYQSQKLEGRLYITWKDELVTRPQITVSNLVNKTHLINDNRIRYYVEVDDYFILPRLNVIGNNKTDKFKTSSIVFYMDANPSYNIGADEPDNTLMLLVSGKGIVNRKYKAYYIFPEWEKYLYYEEYSICNKLKGTVSGNIGCGCREYGHKSPTRLMGPYKHLNKIDDIASVFGTWRAVHERRIIDKTVPKKVVCYEFES